MEELKPMKITELLFNPLETDLGQIVKDLFKTRSDLCSK